MNHPGDARHQQSQASQSSNLTNVDVRGQMFTDQQNAIEADMAPFGFIDNGLDDPEGRDGYFMDSGEIWRPVRVIKGE